MRPTVCGQLQPNPSCAIAFAEDGNVVGITSKEVNIIFDPLDTKSLVFESGVEGLCSP